MDTQAFLRQIEPLTKSGARFARLRRLFERIGLMPSMDPCPAVAGMASPKKLKLLNLAGACLPSQRSECYVEVGTFQGKSLISALVGNPHALGVACDDFSLFDNPSEPKNFKALQENIRSHGLNDRVRFFNQDFRAFLQAWPTLGLPPAGVYFYDGAHDEESQYLGIELAEPILADEALVLVDDWRYAPDSDSRAESGTRRAMARSTHEWKLVLELPARWNGDRDLWWNGLAVLVFKRKKHQT